jgi:menaquinol-cytochrome c reductase iron-sulfur subunit
LRRTGDREFTAFGLNCTHLGCPVNWRPGAELFLCPCHGGVYYADGSVAGGPPPRPLVRYSIRIGGGNRVQVLTRPLQQTIVQG